MTDLEISKALALAIGWESDLVVDKGTRIVCHISFLQAREFDYRDWNIIGPIAARLNCFPVRYGQTWTAWDAATGCEAKADTPQKAIALAVIAISYAQKEREGYETAIALAVIGAKT